MKNQINFPAVAAFIEAMGEEICQPISLKIGYPHDGSGLIVVEWCDEEDYVASGNPGDDINKLLIRATQKMIDAWVQVIGEAKKSPNKEWVANVRRAIALMKTLKNELKNKCI